MTLNIITCTSIQCVNYELHEHERTLKASKAFELYAWQGRKKHE